MPSTVKSTAMRNYVGATVDWVASSLAVHVLEAALTGRHPCSKSGSTSQYPHLDKCPQRDRASRPSLAAARHRGDATYRPGAARSLRGLLRGQLRVRPPPRPFAAAGAAGARASSFATAGSEGPLVPPETIYCERLNAPVDGPDGRGGEDTPCCGGSRCPDQGVGRGGADVHRESRSG